jgi:hypothetical protein
MRAITFTVDAALLRELGERLVGRPHIALAELIKNAYDADATLVEIEFEPDRIEVTDNGHGMSYDEFKGFWMRVGSPHKEGQRVSRGFHRPLTGSKGVGRLAAQFLANDLELRTSSDEDTSKEIYARVDWAEAIRAKELTSAKARYTDRKRSDGYAGESASGTALTLTNLNQRWTAESFAELAREVWWLQPPFREVSASEHDFRIQLSSSIESVVEVFEEQMSAALQLWQARLVGELQPAPKGKRGPTDRILQITLQRPDGRRRKLEQVIENCHVDRLNYEIRVFKLAFRQPRGIQVGKLRSYFNEFGGVHVYDAGFRLPYYGPDSDWLNVEMDHSHRLVRSKLLPPDLAQGGNLTFLPTNSRIFGVVRINTSRERGSAANWRRDRSEHLKIQVSRDRLVDNSAYDQLVEMVRVALDLFAIDEAQLAAEEDLRAPRDTVPAKAARIEDVLDRYSADIPPPVYRELRGQVAEVVRASETEAEKLARRAGLLGALATAGISALAWEHEAVKQYELLDRVAERLVDISRNGRRTEDLEEIAGELRQWVTRARATRALFAPLLDQEPREDVVRPRAAALLDEVREQVSVLVRDVEWENDVDERFRLPAGSFAEWSAIFQNVFLNASNAMLDSDHRKLWAHAYSAGRNRAVVIEDTGAGVDLDEQLELFEPFVRKLEVSRERRALGIGGTGLGLTIVRMVAISLGCQVAFVEPSSGYSTAFRLSWRES